MLSDKGGVQGGERSLSAEPMSGEGVEHSRPKGTTGDRKRTKQEIIVSYRLIQAVMSRSEADEGGPLKGASLPQKSDRDPFTGGHSLVVPE